MSFPGISEKGEIFLNHGKVLAFVSSLTPCLSPFLQVSRFYIIDYLVFFQVFFLFFSFLSSHPQAMGLRH